MFFEDLLPYIISAFQIRWDCCGFHLRISCVNHLPLLMTED